MNKLVLMILVLAIVVLAACNQQPQKETEQEIEPVPEPEGEEQEVVEMEEPEPEVEEVDEEAEEGLERFTELLSDATGIYKVTYDLSTTAQGETIESTMQIIRKGENAKFITSVDESETQVYILSNKFYLCTDSEGTVSCLGIDGSEAQSNAAVDLTEQVEENPQDYTIRPLPPRTIATATTSCFQIVTADAENEFCYSREGVPLYIQFTGTADGQTVESLLEAIVYVTTVFDREFELPAEPTDLSDLLPDGFEIPGQ